MNAVGESEHTQSLMQFLSSFDLWDHGYFVYPPLGVSLKWQAFPMIQILLGVIGNSNPLLIAAAEATATKRNWQLQNSSPIATIDQENKTHCRILPPPRQSTKKTKPIKNKNKKTKKQRSTQCLETARTDRQTDTLIDLIYKMEWRLWECGAL